MLELQAKGEAVAVTDRQALSVAGVTWDEDGVPRGFQIGRSAALLDWQHKREAKEFLRLVWRLQAKKYWAAKDPERKRRIYEYRRQWAQDHPEAVRQMMAKAKEKYRSRPQNRAKEAMQKRERRAVEREKRRAETVYTCVECGAQWSPIGRIPSRPPKYCSLSCRGKVAYRRDKAAGKR